MTTLSTGARIGPYEVIALLGAGGMGEVYKARDTRLDRSVAIKILPPALAGDADFRQRFDREARTISQLEHPHVCPLYDIGDHEGTAYLVMQYLEGETLAARLTRGPLSLADALAIAVPLSDALNRAHRAGVIHRDLKPGNVMLTKSGVKLLDFGLAKTGAPAAQTSGLSMLPTTPPAAITEKGSILGTFQYMAPEQLEGADADARTDIFSFGCVLYEMLTGKPPFSGRSHASLISAIMTSAPAPIAMPGSISPAIDHVLARCLAKDPEDRWQSIADVRAELLWIASAPAPAADTPTVTAAAASSRRRESIAWASAALAIAALAIGATLSTRRATTPAPTSRLQMPLSPADGLTGNISISHDGTRIAFVGMADGKNQLFVRRIDEPNASSIVAGPVFSMAFSPDDQWIAFGEGGRLKKVPSGGGTVMDLAAAGRGGVHGIAWLSADTIAFGVDSAPEDHMEGIRTVSAAGGESQPLTKLDRSKGDAAHLWPVAVPGSRLVLYASRSAATQGWAAADIAGVSLDTGQQQVLVPGGGVPVRVLPSGHLVARRNGNIFVTAFSAAKGEARGSPLGVLQDVLFERLYGDAVIDVSETGTAVYATGLFNNEGRALTYLGRDAKVEDARVAPGSYFDPRVSPDGQRVAVELVDSNDDIWVADLRRGTLTRLTFDSGEDETPVWSPDGKWIAYATVRPGQPRTIFRKAADGSGVEEKLWSSKEHSHVEDWSRDGRTLIASLDTPGARTDIWAIPLDGSGPARPLLATPFVEGNARLSPDGRWIAYESDESGRNEVYVQRFPALGGKAQVSNGGGAQPVWSKNGRELFYRGVKTIMAVDVTAGDAIQFGAPKVVGEDVYANKGGTHTGYDVAPDGRLLFARARLEQANLKVLQIVENWIPELLRRVPAP